MIITKTPYRLSFFGGGTDYRPWFEKNKSLIITSAMARYCYISVRRLPPFFDNKTMIAYYQIETVSNNEDIQHPSVRNCLKFLEIQDGLEIHHDGDLPARSGIGSSSTFTVGLLNALSALHYKMAPPNQLAADAIHVEQNLIQEEVGIQDQIIAAYGGLRIIEMGPGPNYSVSSLIISPEYIKALEEHVLLGFTGINRDSRKYAKTQIENIHNGCSESYLRNIHSIAEEAKQAFLRQESLEEIGRLLDENWKMKQQLSSKMTNDFFDEIYQTAKKNGAFGGKLMGAGGGGFFLFLVPPYGHKAIKEALPNIKVWVPFKIDPMGSRVIFHDVPE